MKKEEVEGVLDSFRFFDSKKSKKEKIELAQKIFGVPLDETELTLSRRDLIELIRIRILKTEICPRCYGAGCKFCRQETKKAER